VTAFLWHLRARAARVAFALAVCQLAVLSVSTIVLAASPRAGGLTLAADEECSCEHTAGVMCPMHRRSTSAPAPADGPRWCKGVDDSSYAVLPVLGSLAMPEPIVTFVFSLTESAAPAVHAEAPRLLDRPPDSPPPRA
jgi:hypothetical protein